jgi:hypothetical protein
LPDTAGNVLILEMIMTSFKRRKMIDDTTSWDEILAVAAERLEDDEDTNEKGD